MALEERLLLDPPQAAGSDLGFDSPWWILYQALVWVAVRSREAVDMAGREPGSHIFAAINNTGGRRMGAAEAAREIHNAMSDGRLNGVRLEDSRAVPVAKHEWASIPFDLSEAGAAAPHGIWWLNYRLSSAAVRKLWPDAADEVATAALARVDQPQAGAAKDAGGRPRKHDKDQFLHEIIRISNQPDGLPERHLLTRQMAQWCEDTWGYQPGDSVLRDWIREVLDYLESARLKRR